MNEKKYPTVSVLIPTLNAKKVVENCLKSLAKQTYPQNLIEIVVADGGSTDRTLEIAKKYNAKIYQNPLKTGEAGKMVALKHATGEFVALIDSDNELPHENWLKNMVDPLLENPQAIGSEPWSYTLRPQDGFITRYCALLGMNDPLVLFLGNYDRLNALTNKWTGLPVPQIDKRGYILVTLNKAGIPTIGANGTIFRTTVIKEHAVGDYLFDIDIIAGIIEKKGQVEFIKVKESIIHSYCESDIQKFARKQSRRIHDFMYHKHIGTRSYPWNTINKLGYIKFVLYCITVFPLIAQSIAGYLHKKDRAWFFHPLACEITFWEYTKGVIKNLFKKSEFNRDKWSQ